MATSTPSNRNGDTQAKTWLKPTQVDALRDACYDTGAEYLQDRNEAIVALMYDLGLRAGETVGLDVEHLDLDARPATVYLPSHIQKGSPPGQTLELGRYGNLGTRRTLQNYLRNRWRDSSALFPSREGDRMTSRQLQRVIKNVAVEAGVEPQAVGGGTGDPEDVTPHTLRHSVAYRIIQEEDGRLEDVQLRLRHATRATTDQIYSHLVPR